MKRILIITDLPILPANAGNKARVWSLMRNLREMGNEVWFLGLGLKPDEEARIREAWGPFVHVLPHLRSRSARPRSYAIKRWMLDRFVCAGAGSPDVDFWYWPHWDREIESFVAPQKFDVVIAEYIFFSKALLHFGPSVLKVIDTHDVFTGRREKLRARRIKRFFRYLTDPQEELRGLQRADAILAIQDHEAAFFRKLLCGTGRVLTVGHLLDIPASPLPRPEPGSILFLGSDYTANVDGIQAFVEQCLPQIAQAIPGFRLLIAGSVCRAVRLAAPGIELLGEVKDLREAYARASVVINPVLAGTGLKTKSVEALAFGRPLVATPCGAEGMEAGRGRAFLQEDLGPDFAKAVICLLKDQAMAARLSAEAVAFARAWNLCQLESLDRLLDHPGCAHVR